MTALRPWSNRNAVTSTVQPSLLDAILEMTEVLSTQSPDLLKYFIRQPPTALLDTLEVALPESYTVHVATHVAAVQAAPAVEEICMVGFQLLDWTLVLIPCPACQCYPCKPGHVNGHTETWLPVAGDLISVRAH